MESPAPSSRHEEEVITRTRIGHYRLTQLHLLYNKKRLPDLGKLCEKQLTINHITLECPKFQTAPTNSRKPINDATSTWRGKLQNYIQFIISQT